MRIGIVTQPPEMNYGGLLQHWAVQQVLKRMGHEPITIDAYQRYSLSHFAFNRTRALLKRLAGKKIKLPKRYKGSLRSQLLGQFVEQHIDKTQVMWHYKPEVVNQYGLEALVVGSDQVWRATYNGDHLEDMFLRFAEGLPLKRVAYAASFGTNEWEYTAEQSAACAALAQQMNAVSVREADGVDLCREHLGVKAQCVLDPTLLLDAERYKTIIDDSWDGGEPYLAVYCLDITPEKEAFFNQLASERGLVVRYFAAGWKAKLSVQQWLAMLSKAAIVVTDSFHGTVFSILFGRDFYTMGNPERGNSRISSLLHSLGLEKRFINASSLNLPPSDDIDWQSVQSLLEQQRLLSMSFLTQALRAKV